MMVLVAIVVALMYSPAAVRAESVHWFSNIEQASSLARESNKPMMIDFWADWCAACKVMEQEVYSTADFAEAALRFVPVRIDFDNKPAIARKYSVNALPTIVFTDSYGAELFRYSGFMDPKPLSDLLRSLPADVTRLNQLNRTLARDKKNFDALSSMGHELRAAELYLASNDFYNK